MLAHLLAVCLLLPIEHAAAQTMPSDTAGLLELARSTDTALRRRAAQTLAREYKKRWLGDEAVPVLRERLADPDPETRMFAAMGLGGIASLRYIAAGSADGTAFGRKVEADPSRDAALLPALLKALEDRKAEVREYSAVTLGFAYPPRSEIEAAFLRRWPKEKDKFVRRALLIALGKAGYRSPKALALVRRAAAKDPEPRVRQRAEETLRIMTSPARP